MPPEHLPGGRGHARPGPAQEIPGQAGTRRELLLLHRRRSARDHGAVGHPQVRRPDRPRRSAGHAFGRGTLEGAGAGLRARVPSNAVGRRRAPDRRARPRPGRRAGPPVDRPQPPRAGTRRKGVLHRAGAQPQPHDRRHAVGRRGFALRPRRPAGRHHPHPVQRHRRPKLRRVPGARHHDGPGGRRQRLRRQGLVGRPHHRALAQRLPRLRPRPHHRRQHRAVRRAGGRSLLQWRGRRTLRGAQLRRRHGGGRHGRPRLRIHDRRHRRGAGRHRPQLRGGHVGRRGVRLGSGTHAQAPRQPVHGGTGSRGAACRTAVAEQHRHLAQRATRRRTRNG
ncbi:hypothetical protein D3C78_1109740 [compost metagenome]